MPHPKDKARQRDRQASAIARENIVLVRLAQGRRNSEIAREVEVHEASVSNIIKRGLERRAAEDRPTVEAARQLYLMQLWELLRSWMPLALGTYVVDDDTGATAPPDFRAAGICIQLVDKIAAASGQGVVADTTKLGQIDLVHSIDPTQANTLRQQIMTSLAAITAKQGAVDAEFIEHGADFTRIAGHQPEDDRPSPPQAGGAA